MSTPRAPAGPERVETRPILTLSAAYPVKDVISIAVSKILAVLSGVFMRSSIMDMGDGKFGKSVDIISAHNVQFFPRGAQRDDRRGSH